MADVKWIKIVTDIFDDEKILLIEAMPEADSLITIWFKLLCLAGKQNNSGVFMLNDRIAYTDEMFATIFRRKLNTVRLALSTFENLGMIEIVNGTVTIPNWGKHQNLDQISAKNEYMRNYMREYRERQKAITAAEEGAIACKTNSKANSKANVSSLDIDKELDIEKESNIVRKRTRFTPPTASEVAAYCTEKGYKLDADYFVDYYSARGWKLKTGPVSDWKACVRTWVRNDKKRQEEATAATTRDYSDELPY